MASLTEHHKKHQEALVNFLQVDLDLAFTILQTARIESGKDAAHSLAALAKVREALVTIRRFSERVEEPAVRQSILSRADELESQVTAVSPSIDQGIDVTLRT